MGLQVDTAFVWVTDLDRALAWYSAIGIEPGPRYGAWQNMIVDGETRFALHEGDRPSGAATAVIAFRVDDLDAEIDRLGHLGIEPSDPEVTNTGVARFTTFTDPDANDIQLMQR
jgi:predicted enzyme related to lactoylglutathione lyase